MYRSRWVVMLALLGTAACGGEEAPPADSSATSVTADTTAPGVGEPVIRVDMPNAEPPVGAERGADGGVLGADTADH